MLNTSPCLVESGVRGRSTLMLLCAIGCVTSAFAAQRGATVQGPIVVHDFANVGVRLIPSTDPEFDARMAALIPEWSKLAVGLKPYLVILSNQSERTIVAYCVSFQTTDSGGRVHQRLVHFNYPNAVAGATVGQHGLPRGREVSHGEERVVGTNFEIMPDVDNRWLTDFATGQSEQFAQVRKLDIGIDAMIFDDGRLIGEDTSELQAAFEKYLNTTQEIYRSVVSRIDRGMSVDEVFQWLRTTAGEARNKGSDDLNAFYYVQATGDAWRARRKIGDEGLRDVFAGAIRKTPFIVRRDMPKERQDRR